MVYGKSAACRPVLKIFLKRKVLLPCGPVLKIFLKKDGVVNPKAIFIVVGDEY